MKYCKFQRNEIRKNKINTDTKTIKNPRFRWRMGEGKEWKLRAESTHILVTLLFFLFDSLFRYSVIPYVFFFSLSLWCWSFSGTYRNFSFCVFMLDARKVFNNWCDQFFFSFTQFKPGQNIDDRRRCEGRKKNIFFFFRFFSAQICSNSFSMLFSSWSFSV